VAAAEGWLDAGLVDLLAFNDHVPHIASRLDSPAGLAVYAERTGLDPEEFAARFELMRERSAAGLGVAARLAAAARRRGLPMASHDDETPEMRRAYRALGSTICEFPVDALHRGQRPRRPATRSSWARPTPCPATASTAGSRLGRPWRPASARPWPRTTSTPRSCTRPSVWPGRAS